MGSIWQVKTYLYNAASLLSRRYVNKRFKIFLKRYCESQWVKGLQSCSPLNIEDDQNCPGLKPGPYTSGLTLATRQNFLFNLQLWQLVTWEPFDIQRPTVLLWKDLESIVNILSVQETGCILKIDFDLSKWPHFHRAYVVTVPFILILAVAVLAN